MGNIVSPKFRGSYVSVMKPRKMFEDSEPQYEITIVIPKNDKKGKEFIADIEDAMDAAMKDKFGKPIPFTKCKHFPIRDGDESDEEQFHGHWLIGAKNKRRPGVLVLDEDGNRRPVEDESEIYSGAWYHASVNVYAWDNKFGKGVSISLEGVLKVEDDEQFGGSFREDDFDDVAPAGDKPARRGRNEDERPARRGRNEDERPARRESSGF